MSTRVARPFRKRRLAIESLEDRTQPATIQPLKVALISDAVAQADPVQAAAASGVVTVTYDAETASLGSLVGLLQGVSEAHGGAPIERLGLVAHGSPGAISLGRFDKLEAADVAADSLTWARLRYLLTPSARLDLYSCDVAAGSGGKAFVNALARRTGADVYASTDAVGNVPGADLVWEYHTGTRGGSPLFQTAALKQIAGLALLGPYEPNNDLQTTANQPEGAANSPNFGVVTGGKTINAVMEDNDVDYYRFVLAGPGQNPHFVSIAHSASAPDLAMRILDSAGTLIAESWAGGASDMVRLWGLKSGAYYVHVYPLSELFGTAYTLRIEAPLATPDDAYESNNSIVEAANLGTVAGSLSLVDLVQNDSRQEGDWFRFTTTATGTDQHFVSIAYNGPGGEESGAGDGNIDLELYKGDGTWLRESFAGGPIDRIDMNGDQAGTYYLRVYGADPARPAMASYDLLIQVPGSSLSVSGGGVSVTEGDAGLVNADFTITRSDGTGTASVNYTTADSTAVAGADYVAKSGTASFADQQLTTTVTIQVKGDVIDEPDEKFFLNLSNAVNTTIKVSQAVGTILDDDAANVIVTPSGGGTSVTEGGDTDSYTVRLVTQPAADVTIAITPGSQVTTSPPTLTFTSANWSVAQTVTVTAVNDAVAEGTHLAVITHTASSTDSHYNGVDVPDVPVTITDNDLAGVLVVESGGNTTVSESGSNDTYSVVLTSQPTVNVNVQLSTSIQLNVPALLTFTPANWNSPQVVTVSAVNDSDDEGTHSAVIAHSATSADSKYNQIAVNSVNVTILDNDTKPALVVVQSGGTTAVTEGGSSDTFTVALSTQPTADVIVGISPGSQLTASKATLTFTSVNWNVFQSVTVNAIDDAVAEGTHLGDVTLTPTSADANYNTLPPVDLPVTIADNDQAGVLIVENSGNTNVSEAGATDTYSIVLTSQPTVNVTVQLSTSVQLNLVPALLTFTPANWSTPQVVTVSAVDDSADEGTHSAVISHSVTSADGKYHQIAVNNVNVTIFDNDTRPALVIVQSGGTTAVAEGGSSDTISVALKTQPTADVTVSIAPGSQLTASKTALTFTTGNWNVSQSVTVNAVDDAAIEGPHLGTLTLTPTSADANYNGLPPADIAVSVTDNDATLSAVLDAFGVPEDSPPKSLAVLANDKGSGLLITSITQGASGQVAITGGGTGLTYEPNDNFTGTDLFSYTITDANGDTATADVLVNVIAVNDEPLLSTPVAQTIRVNTPLTINGLYVSDPDVLQGDGQLKLALSVKHGTLTLPTTAGLNFTTGDGIADSSMTFTGLVSNVTAAISSLTYRPHPDSLSVDALDISVDDLGNYGSGGPGTASGSVPLNPLTGQVLLQANPTSTKLKDLVVYGTNNAETISVTGSGTTFKVAGVGGSTQTITKVNGRILVFGFDGNDRLFMTKVGRSGVLDGGAGNDTVVGGSKNDRLSGNVGDDLLDGGKGIDRLVEVGTSFTLVQGTATANGSLIGLGNDALVNNSIEEADLTGGDGNDTIDASTFSGKTWLSGGGGNDVLRGGTAGGVLLGGAGDDQLFGGVGRDVLIGGLGVDVQKGGAGEDLLIGGTTIHDTDKFALDLIVAEWTNKSRPYALRIKRLLGTAPGGANKTFLLNATTVSHDGLANTLTGEGDLDWFFEKSPLDITDADPTETRTTLS